MIQSNALRAWAWSLVAPAARYQTLDGFGWVMGALLVILGLSFFLRNLKMHSKKILIVTKERYLVAFSNFADISWIQVSGWVMWKTHGQIFGIMKKMFCCKSTSEAIIKRFDSQWQEIDGSSKWGTNDWMRVRA